MNQGARTEEGRQARQRAAGADLLLGNLESSRPCGRYCDARLRLVAEQETVAPWWLWRLSPALICTFNVSFWPLDFPKLTQTGRKIMSDLQRSSPPGLQDLLLTSGWQVQQTFRGGGHACRTRSVLAGHYEAGRHKVTADVQILSYFCCWTELVSIKHLCS